VAKVKHLRLKLKLSPIPILRHKHLSLWARAALRLTQQLLVSLVWAHQTNIQILWDSGIIRKYNLSNAKVARAKELNYGRWKIIW
jgi:hypothetical protein